MLRASSRGNIHHDSDGKFTFADNGKIKVEHDAVYYAGRTEQRVIEDMEGTPKKKRKAKPKDIREAAKNKRTDDIVNIS